MKGYERDMQGPGMAIQKATNQMLQPRVLDLAWHGGANTLLTYSSLTQSSYTVQESVDIICRVSSSMMFYIFL